MLSLGVFYKYYYTPTSTGVPRLATLVISPFIQFEMNATARGVFR